MGQRTEKQVQKSVGIDKDKTIRRRGGEEWLNCLLFLAFTWFIVTIAGNIMVGGSSGGVVVTTLTSAITASTSTIPVNNANGLPATGIVQIGDERIAYASKSSTALTGTLAKPLVRGTDGTTAAVHASSARVYTVESSVMNRSMAYDIAVLADASGTWAAVSIGLALMRLLGNFFWLPMSFLGTDLQMLTFLWIAIGLGALVTFGLALAGSRRV